MTTATKRMTATWDRVQHQIKSSHRKEGKLYREYSIIDASPAKRHEDRHGNRIWAPSPVTVRTYWPGEQCYACIWVSTDDFYTAGSGSAGGYGYCLESAAIDSAISNAGIKLSHSIHGVGESAIFEAMVAIARMCKIRNFILHGAHG